MKLRFREHSMRLRVNRQEVAALTSGQDLKETVYFPENAQLRYELAFAAVSAPTVSFARGTITVLVPQGIGTSWAQSSELGFYFESKTSEYALRVALEKDLECLHGPEDERDPNAFPRTAEL